MVTRAFRMYSCRVAGVEAVAAATDHCFPRHFHTQYGFGVIESGAQKSASGRGMVEAGPGDLITVNPGEIHDGTPIGDAGRSWRMLYFDPVILAEASRDLSEGAGGDLEFTRPVINDARFPAPFSALFAAAAHAEDAAWRLRYDELLLPASVLSGRRAETHAPPQFPTRRKGLTMRLRPRSRLRNLRANADSVVFRCCADL